MVATEDKDISVADAGPIEKLEELLKGGIPVDKQMVIGNISNVRVTRGVQVYPQIDKPYISWKHVDGPYLKSRDGSIHWLSYWDRFLFWTGWITEYDLEKKYAR